ncbi:type II toxin-antitoxin system RelE/ParE family toxin [soil metagenome]
MTKYTVVIEADAERDLDDIAEFIAEHGSIDRAIDVSARIEQSIAGLTTFPNRGAHPKELLAYGNRDFREIRFKPYRILYRVADRRVFVVLIADGRRDMQALLTRRLLGA